MTIDRAVGCVVTLSFACTSLPPQAGAVAAAGAIKAPEDYVIGTDDVLAVMFWRDKDMSTDVVVRPDGKITLPLINDIRAAGLTPDQLREQIFTEAARYIEDPSPTIIVKQINSRRVFITGMVEKPGPYALTAPTTVLQLIALAGGLREEADRKDIVIMRTETGRQTTFEFDYSAVAKRTKLHQNIFLKPGDTVVVP
jgi:polysaccharide export outer membrane protein